MVATALRARGVPKRAAWHVRRFLARPAEGSTWLGASGRCRSSDVDPGAPPRALCKAPV